jgi:hypothetical protein
MLKKTLPTFVPPMMAKITEVPFDSPDWIFEVKLDGYRGIAVFDAAGKPHLWSRNGLPLEKKFPAVTKALSETPNYRPVPYQVPSRRKGGASNTSAVTDASAAFEQLFLSYVSRFKKQLRLVFPFAICDALTRA